MSDLVPLDDLPSASRVPLADLPGQPPPAASAQPAGFWSQVASSIVRPAVKAAAGFPALAADAGIGVRNLTEAAMNRYAPDTMASIYGINRKLAGNSDVLAAILPGGPPAPGRYPQNYSQMLDEQLNRVTTAPTSTLGKVGEFGSTLALGAFTPSPTVANAAPEAFITARQAALNAAAQKAQTAGYVIPPSQANPTVTNRLLEGLSGKLKLQQEASLANQPVTQTLGARALGQNPDAVLTADSLNAIRANADKVGYEPVRKFGQMVGDETYHAALDNVAAGATGAERSFPGVTQDPKVAAALEDINALKVPSFDSKDAITAIRMLRNKADDAFSGGSSTAGRMYKETARALEDAIERNLGSAGSDMLGGYRAARQLMAQTYSTGKALVDEAGTLSAPKFAQMLKSGTPLVGDQRTIAEFARSFPKAAKVMNESYPSISPLDAYGSAIAAGASHSVAPLAVPLSRVAARAYLLSPAGQARAIAKPIEAATTIGLPGSLLPTLNEYFGLSDRVGQ